MTALFIIGIVLAIGGFFGLGYYLWSFALSRYDHNIFNVGVIIRGIVSLLCLTFAVMLDVGDGSAMVWLTVAAILWLWTFFATWRNSNIFIAFFSLIYQGVSAILFLYAINRIKRGLN